MCMNLIAVSFFLLALRWQRYYKLRLIIITLGYDTTSVKLYDLTGNGKSQSRTARLSRTGIIQAIEFFKNRLQLGAGNLLTLILKYNLYIATLSMRINADRRVLITVCHSIPENIVKYTSQLVRISLHFQIILCFHLTGQMLLLKHSI